MEGNGSWYSFKYSKKSSFHTFYIGGVSEIYHNITLRVFPIYMGGDLRNQNLYYVIYRRPLFALDCCLLKFSGSAGPLILLELCSMATIAIRGRWTSFMFSFKTLPKVQRSRVLSVWARTPCSATIATFLSLIRPSLFISDFFFFNPFLPSSS